MFFDKVFIIGSGSICINIIKSLQSKGITPVAILYREHNMSPLSMFLKSKNIEHHSFDDKNTCTEFLNNVDKNSLIISANNIFLFPKNIVCKENLKIINFHNALLPAHRGMNAPTWTIFEQDKIAGITWHLVNQHIDDGDIIIQKSIELDNTETSILLIRKLMNLAFLAYKEIEDAVLNWSIAPTPMKDGEYQIHYSKDVPNDGFLNKNWKTDKISAFLRSLDWGCVKQFEKPKIKIDSKTYTINNYTIKNKETIEIITNHGIIEFIKNKYTVSPHVKLGGGGDKAPFKYFCRFILKIFLHPQNSFMQSGGAVRCAS